MKIYRAWLDLVVLDSPTQSYCSGMIFGIIATLFMVAVYKQHMIRRAEMRKNHDRPYNWDTDEPYWTPQDFEILIKPRK